CGDVACNNLAGTLLFQGHDLRLVGMHLEDDLLEIQDDVGHVLVDAGDARKLMENPQRFVELYPYDGRSVQGGQENPPQGVADGHSESPLQRLSIETGIRRSECALHYLQLAGFYDFFPVLLNHSIPLYLIYFE